MQKTILSISLNNMQLTHTRTRSRVPADKVLGKACVNSERSREEPDCSRDCGERPLRLNPHVEIHRNDTFRSCSASYLCAYEQLIFIYSIGRVRRV